MDDLDRAILGVLMPGFAGPTLPTWLADDLGAGLGSVCLFASNIADPDQLRELTGAIHAARPDALVATDEEGGDVTRLHHAGGSPYPSAAWLGRVDSPALTESAGRSLGRELAASGIDLDLAPVADVNSNPNNPVIGIRSFGADPELVARHVAAMVRGLQSSGVAATAKHFPGHGDTATDSHLGLPRVERTLAELFARELVPFVAAVEAGALAVMTSHLLVPALDLGAPVTLSPHALSLLRTELGFGGAIVTDALDMAGASGGGRGIPEAAVLALAAGADLLCIGTNNTAAQLASICHHVRDAVVTGRLAADRVEEAAGRVAQLATTVAARRAYGIADVLAESSGRAVVTDAGFDVRRPVTPLVEPVFLRLATPANIAVGEGVWGIGEHLRAELDAALPGATCVTVGDPDELDAALAAHRGRPLVVQGRDLARVPFLAASVLQVRLARPDALVVELGWPQGARQQGASGPSYDIATYGSSRGTALALVGLLAEGSR